MVSIDGESGGKYMHIRAATTADISAIANLHAASWRYAYRGALSEEYLAGDIVADRMALWTQRLTALHPQQLVIVAEENYELVGFACAFAASDLEWGTLLDNIHVSQSHQRRGIGVRLMHKVTDWCVANAPSSGLYLWVLQSNMAAQRFYEALGAKNVGVDFWMPPGGGSVPRFRYSWKSAASLF